MSYILDALKRADAEREREHGNVPGLHSHGTAIQARTGAPAMGRRTLMLGATVLAVAAALVWWWNGHAPAAPQPAAASTAASQIAARLALAPPSPPPASALPILAPEPAPVPPPAVPPAPLQAPVALPVAAPPVATPVPPDTAAHNPDVGVPKPPTPATAPARPASTLPVYASGVGPEVKISGATYSENPAHRMLIANGLVLHEGQDIAPDLKLEVIGPRGAVLNHRGTRYNIQY